MPAVSPTLLAVLTIGVVALILGILIGSYTMPPQSVSSEAQRNADLLNHLIENHYSGVDDKIVHNIIDETNADNIMENLKFLSIEPHLPGSARDEQLATHIRNTWIDNGLDDAFLVPYNVLLSYSNTSFPNKVHIIDKKGDILFSSQHRETPLRNEEMNTNFVHAYHSFSPKGDVIGDPVFCNFGREKDFDLLENIARIDLKGKICIIKYGKIFRGNKCENAAKRNCIGCILYSDPLDVAREGTEPENVYPNTWWMPGRAMQRGNMGMGTGDFLTPGFPAIEGAFRYNLNDIQLPKIPSQPIGYDDALEILKIMGGIPVPDIPEFHDWNGALNITYKLGPGFNEQNSDKKLRLVVNNQLKQKTVYNVIGILKGSLEADRYVILGNHRDSWGFGAMDAASGGAAMMEVTRIFGKLHKEDNWNPRRTMVFGSWGAEEFGLIGSTEWVEEHVNLLSQRAVAYINVDTCIKGPHFSPDASPSLMSVLREVSQIIPFTPTSNMSIYEDWKIYQSSHSEDFDEPKIRTLGSGYDHAPFAFYAGIPSINIQFDHDKHRYPMDIYPAYHTGYETYHLVKTFIDPEFSLHQCCSRLIGVLMHAIADSTLMPYDFTEFAYQIQSDYEKLKKNESILVISKSKLTDEPNKKLIEMLEMAMSNFTEAAIEWKERIKKLDFKNPIKVRQMNDLMLGVERAFIKPEGLHERAQIRHVLYAPFKYDKYSRMAFPGIHDLIFKIVDAQKNDPSQVPHYVKLLGKHISDVAIMIKSACRLLKRNPLK